MSPCVFATSSTKNQITRQALEALMADKGATFFRLLFESELVVSSFLSPIGTSLLQQHSTAVAS